MIKFWNGEAKWLPQADLELSFSTMIDFLTTAKLIQSFNANVMEYPNLYKEHTDLVLTITSIFFPTKVFTPNKISVEGTDEFCLFQVLSKIIQLTKYYKLEAKHGKDGYSIEKKNTIRL